MTKSLEAHDKLIKDIFSDEFQFRIPDYQRPYSWTTEQAGELLNDVLDAMRDFQTSNSTDNAFYFLGSIVLIKADRIPYSDVVDGQQRLTTLTILFSALRALLPNKARALTAFLYKEGLGIRDDEPNEYRLSAFQEDEAFFRDYIQEPGGIQRLVTSTEKLVDSRLRFKENAALFLEEMGKLTEEERASLLGFLAYKCSMVVISTFIAALDGDIYKKLPKARAALILRLETLKSDGSKKQEFTNVSIEHILPQTPSVESGWLDIFPDTERREAWTQRLANLVPLHIRKNPAASNFDFETKKNVYFAGNDGTASPFVLTQEVRSLPAWTPEVLEDRQQKLLDIFSRHWSLQLTE